MPTSCTVRSHFFPTRQNSSEVMVNLSASDEISVVVFNSLAWERDVVVTVPTNL